MSYDEVQFDSGADDSAFEDFELEIGPGSGAESDDCANEHCQHNSGGAGRSVLDERDLGARAADFRMNEAPSSLLESGSTGRTGPKGVKEDFAEAKRNLRNIRMRERIQRERAIQSKIEVKTELKSINQQNTKLSSDESSEDEEFERYRKSQLDQIKFFQSNLPVFGTFERVETKGAFASLVRDIHESVYCVCHVYDNSVESCVRINFSLEEIAKQFTHVKFVRARAVDLMPKYLKGGLPTFLVYRGGELVSSAIRVTDVLPSPFTDLDVAKLLQAKNILNLPTGMEAKVKKQKEFQNDAEDKDNQIASRKAKVRSSKPTNSALSDDSD